MNRKTLIANRELVIQLIKRDISSRYRGSMFGGLWSLLTPLLMLAVYTFVFSIVFKAKWGGVNTESNFSIVLFSGLIIHSFFSEVLLTSANLIVGNSNYVKRVVFPLQVLSISSTFSAVFNFCISFFVLVGANLIFGGSITKLILFAPLVVMPLIILAIGFSWLISAIGVYIRDINQVIGVICSVLLFISPIFFSIEMLPETFKVFIYMNPLTFIIQEFRNVVIWGVMPNLEGVAIYTILSCLFTTFSYHVFYKLKKGFADVL